MNWHFSSDAPIWSQITELLRLGVASGSLPPGERLKSVRELALEAGVNPNTMQRALAELERSGLIYAQRTSGRFVTEDTELIAATKREIARENVMGFLSAMQGLGYKREDVPALIEDIIKEEDTNGNTEL